MDKKLTSTHKFSLSVYFIYSPPYSNYKNKMKALVKITKMLVNF